MPFAYGVELTPAVRQFQVLSFLRRPAHISTIHALWSELIFQLIGHLVPF